MRRLLHRQGLRTPVVVLAVVCGGFAAKVAEAQGLSSFGNASFGRDTMQGQVLRCINKLPDFETALDDLMAHRPYLDFEFTEDDRGEGLTVFREIGGDGPAGELHIQTVVNGEAYCLGFAADATLEDANQIVSELREAGSRPGIRIGWLYEEVAAPAGTLTFEHRFADYTARVASVIVDGSGAGIMISVSGITDRQLELLYLGDHVPPFAPDNSVHNIQAVEMLGRRYCSIHWLDADAVVAQLRHSGATVVPHGAGFVGRWEHAPYYVYVQAFTGTQPYQCAVAASGFTVADMRDPGRSIFHWAVESPDPDGPPGALLFEFPSDMREQASVIGLEPGNGLVARTFAVDGGAGVMLETRPDPTWENIDALEMVVAAFNSVCIRTDLEPPELQELAARSGGSVAAMAPTFTATAERPGSGGLSTTSLQSCEIHVEGSLATELIAHLPIDNPDEWRFGSATPMPAGISMGPESRYIGTFEDARGQITLVEVGVRMADGIQQTFLRADLLAAD